MKKMKLHRIISMAAAVAILASCCGIVEAIESEIELQKTAEAKIGPLLKEQLDTKSGEPLEVIVWTDDIDSTEIQRQALSENKRLYTKLSANKVPTNEETLENLQKHGTDEEIQTYIERKRELSRAAYTKYNKEVIETLLPSDAKVVFSSRYSPVVVAEMNPDDVYGIARNSSVQSLEYNLEEELIGADSGTIAIETIRAEYNRDTLGYKGSGVKIGQYESYLPHKTKAPLRGANITTIGSGSEAPTFSTGDTQAENMYYHASVVAALIVGQSSDGFHGIVPLAQLYSVGGGTTVSFSNDSQNIELLLDQGVNVINCSRRIGQNTTTNYDDMSKWLGNMKT